MHTLRPQMAIYLVTPLAQNHALIGGALAKLEGAEVFQLQGGCGFLVHFSGTSIELGKQSLITEPGGPGSALITAIGTYYGRGPTDMWEWLKTRFESH